MTNDVIKTYYIEWRLAEKDGDHEYALACKNEYTRLVRNEIHKPYHFFIEKLKIFPTIILN